MLSAAVVFVHSVLKEWSNSTKKGVWLVSQRIERLNWSSKSWRNKNRKRAKENNVRLSKCKLRNLERNWNAVFATSKNKIKNRRCALPVLRLLRSYSRAFRVISVSSVIKNLLLKKFELACVKNAPMKWKEITSVQSVKAIFQVARTWNNAVELNKRLPNNKNNKQ